MATTLVLAAAAAARATTIPYLTDSELIAVSDRVVHGRVVEVRTESGPGATIHTVARIAVIEDFTGVGDAVIEVREIGGELNGRRMFVPGAATYLVGQEVVLCLEETGQATLRSVAMSFAKFDVFPTAGGAAIMLRQGGGAHVLGAPLADTGLRTPAGFRSLVTSVKGTAPIRPLGAGVVGAGMAGDGGPVSENFTLLGGGIRWNQVDSGVSIAWYRSPDAPAPVSSGNGVAEMLTALQTWTTPASGAITLAYSGTRSAAGQDPYCSPVNAGVGLVSFEDPLDEIGSGVLAVGGGCATSTGAKYVNGTFFSSFSHGFVVFNDAAQIGSTYKTSTNYTRILAHELGHAIGLGHTPTSQSGATSNLMYPSCCSGQMPVPPAMGPDDLDGLEFIYPVAGDCTYSLSPTSAQMPSVGGFAGVTITASSGCSWTAVSGESWISITGSASGSGSGSILYTVASNQGATERVGTIAIGGQTVTITQSGSSCTYTLSPATVSYAAAAASGTASLTVANGCDWHATPSHGWITITGGGSGPGSGAISYAVSANTGSATRVGGITAGGKTLTITQAGAACTATVSPSQASYPQGGGSANASVTLPNGCDWTASSSAAWLTITAGSGSGTGTVTYAVAANPTPSTRQASLTVLGKTVTVSQAGLSCSYDLAPSSSMAPAAGLSGTVSLTASAGACAWTVESQSTWITVSGAESGAGSAAVGFAVAANTAPTSRTGVLVVAGETFTVHQNAIADDDDDGLPDDWESRFGLSPGSGSGSNGPNGDPDGDGLTNVQELEGGTHPRGFETRYLAEGAASDFFTTRVSMVNPSATDTALTLLRFQAAGGITVARYLTVPPLSRRTVTSNEVPELDGLGFSTVIEADVPVVIDRVMEWGGGYAAHAEAGVAAPATEWYLAEGATQSGFDLFYLLQNPGTVAATVEVTYLLPAPRPPVVKHYAVPAATRYTIWVDLEAPELAATDVSAVLRSTNGVPIIVERAMYMNAGGVAFRAGHNSAGIVSPDVNWFLAEGATGDYFDMFVLIANPNTSPAAVTARFLRSDGAVVTRTYTVAAHSRFSIWVDLADPLLADAAVSVEVTSTNNVPIIVERAMWWPGSAATWFESHNSPGATEADTNWALADAEVGGARDTKTYLLVANTSTVAASVRVTLLFESGAPVSKTFTVLPSSRFSVDVAAQFPAAAGRRFGAVLESLGSPATPIVVERAMYWNVNGVAWSAGIDSLATPLP